MRKDGAPDAPYGGPGWRPRTAPLREELGGVWSRCGTDSEWRPLRRVLLHRPGPELRTAADPGAVSHPGDVLMLERPDPERAAAQHDGLAAAYRRHGVRVEEVRPPEVPPPNQMFVADLFFMTPEGAVVGRPASAVRAGEERWVARALAELGVPILRTVRGEGTFEGADAAWLAPDAVLLAEGLRTNRAGADQVAATLAELRVRTHRTRLPRGTMHLMGQLRFLDEDLAVGWPGRLPEDAVGVLRDHGFETVWIPDEEEARRGHALNFVTLGPRRIVMPAGNPRTRAFYESLGAECIEVAMDELVKAAGAVGCLTGVLERE